MNLEMCQCCNRHYEEAELNPTTSEITGHCYFICPECESADAISKRALSELLEEEVPRDDFAYFTVYENGEYMPLNEFLIIR